MFSLRMPKAIREALDRAAEQDGRSTASLVDRILVDYLKQEGLLAQNDTRKERRRFPRKKIALPSTTYLRGSSLGGSLQGVIRDISLGGVLLSYPRGFEAQFGPIDELPAFVLNFSLPFVEKPVSLSCKTCRVIYSNDEIQVGAIFGDVEESNKIKLIDYLT